ncbi:MAG: oligosaccharide flippase family protein [Methylococcales bacterium]|nr:oligosaccharide flippase family protein [Methylococcales bacterium]
MSLKKNVIANYLGQGWVALMGLAFIPLYIKYLGIEAYGVIGIFALLQVWLGLLDVGMTPALSREMALFTGGAHSAQSIRDLLRSIEIVVLGMAVLVASGIWAASGWLASDWLKVEKLPMGTVAQAFTIMGVISALRFIENIYRSCIVGLQKQVALNIINSIMATLKGLGAVGILIWVSPTIEAFFLWQGMISILTLGMFIYIVYHTLPTTDQKGRFSLPALKGIRRYAAGMVGHAFLSLLLTQVDKILLSKLLPLEAFGYYSLAAIVAGALFTLVFPITQGFFPSFSKIVANQNQTQLIRIYHKSTQLATVIMGSAAIILMVFAEPILHLWTHNATLALRSAPLVSLLALGNLLNGLTWIPYQAQLAYGWTSFTIKVEIICVAVIVPAIFWVAPLYGAIGVACIWVVLNAGIFFIGYQFMFRKILSGEKWRWYFQDTLIPLWWSTFSVLLISWLVPYPTTNLMQVLWLSTVSIIGVITSALSTPFVRSSFKSIHVRLNFNL